MNEPQDAKLAYLTNPDQRVVIIHIQVGDGEPAQFRLNREQLFNLNSASADMLLRNFK
jgi:hypothetical protein